MSKYFHLRKFLKKVPFGNEINSVHSLPLILISKNLPKLRYFGIISLRQCSSYASIRIQRVFRLIQLYKLLYNERRIINLFQNIYGRWYRELLRPRLQAAFGSGILMSAVGFSFVDNGINDEEMLRASDLISDANRVSPETDFSKEEKRQIMNINHHARDADAKIREEENNATSKWERIITKDHFQLSRRPLPHNPYLYEYRCAGTYTDITPTTFFIAQMDLEYRKEWDRLVISLDVVDVERNSGTEVVRWVTHFPYPMYPREYVYVRRACVDVRQGTFVLISKAVEHPSCYRDEKKFVRVDAYYSCLVVKAHKSVDDNGFDYVLTYFDDPKAPFPKVAYNWMVNAGVLGFLEKVHNAARGLSTKRSALLTSGIEQQSGSNQSLAYWQRLISERYNYSF